MTLQSALARYPAGYLFSVICLVALLRHMGDPEAVPPAVAEVSGFPPWRPCFDGRTFCVERDKNVQTRSLTVTESLAGALYHLVFLFAAMGFNVENPKRVF